MVILLNSQLYVYPKGKQDDLTADQLKQLKAIVERW
jgi:hypothetical protein